MTRWYADTASKSVGLEVFQLLIVDHRSVATLVLVKVCSFLGGRYLISSQVNSCVKQLMFDLYRLSVENDRQIDAARMTGIEKSGC